ITADPRVILQRLPGQGIVIVAETQETAEAEHRVGHPSADLVNHHPLDRADLGVVGTEHGSAFDLVAADQIAELALVHFFSRHGHAKSPHSCLISQPLGAPPSSSGTMPEPGVFCASLSLGSRVASCVADLPGSVL